MRSKQQIFKFMDSKPHLVLSSLNSDGQPQSAVVGFGQTDTFELVIGTSVDSRKYRNVVSNARVSAVIGWNDGGTLQYEGDARILEGDDVEKYSEVYFSKNPGARHYKDDPSERYILVSPRWIRFTEVAYSPWRITELEF